MTEPLYYRNRNDGQRGTLVHEQGKPFIKLDRAIERILVPYDVGTWEPERDTRKLNWHHTAKIAFVADVELCRALGLHDLARRNWDTMLPEDRQYWAEQGPGLPKSKRANDVLRMKLFRANMDVLEPETTKAGD